MFKGNTANRIFFLEAERFFIFTSFANLVRGFVYSLSLIEMNIKIYSCYMNVFYELLTRNIHSKKCITHTFLFTTIDKWVEGAEN